MPWLRWRVSISTPFVPVAQSPSGGVLDWDLRPIRDGHGTHEAQQPVNNASREFHQAKTTQTTALKGGVLKVLRSNQRRRNACPSSPLAPPNLPRFRFYFLQVNRYAYGTTPWERHDPMVSPLVGSWMDRSSCLDAPLRNRCPPSFLATV